MEENLKGRVSSVSVQGLGGLERVLRLIMINSDLEALWHSSITEGTFSLYMFCSMMLTYLERKPPVQTPAPEHDAARLPVPLWRRL